MTTFGFDDVRCDDDLVVEPEDLVVEPEGL